jgi:hypothetical protein
MTQLWIPFINLMYNSKKKLKTLWFASRWIVYFEGMKAEGTFDYRLNFVYNKKQTK